MTDLFFRSIPDFEVVSGGRFYTLTPDTVWNSTRLDFISRHECPVKPYTKLSRAEKNSVISRLREQNLDIFLPEEGDEVISELSLCNSENDHINALVIFRRSKLPDTIELSFIMAEPDKEEYLAGILNEVFNRLQESYRDHNIVFSVDNRESELLTKRFIRSDMKVKEILTAVSFGEV